MTHHYRVILEYLLKKANEPRKEFDRSRTDLADALMCFERTDAQGDHMQRIAEQVRWLEEHEQAR